MENTKNENNSFEYSYSSKKQQEIERLREKYASLSQDDALSRMKELDSRAEKNAARQPVIFGAVGCVLLGLGMCGTMAFSGKVLFVLGIIVGVIGIVLISVAYPLYTKNIKTEREKIAPEMLKLADGAGR